MRERGPIGTHLHDHTRTHARMRAHTVLTLKDPDNHPGIDALQGLLHDAGGV